MKTLLNNNGSDHFDNDITDRDGIPFDNFCPFAGFDRFVAEYMARFDRHFGLSAGIDEV